MQGLTLRVSTALLAALAVLALPTRALDFGEVEVLSGIGQKLDARIPLKAGPGEWFHATCLSFARPAATTALPALPDGVVSVERRSRGANVRLRSASPVNDPAVAFGITSTCDGKPEGATREFSVLLDLPKVDRAPAAPRATAPRVVASRPRVIEPRPTAARPTTPAEPVAPPRELPTARAPAPPAPATAPSESPPRKGGFVLRLSSAPIDTTRSRGFDDKSRAVLRERLRLLDSDDQVAAMLALRDNMHRLEARVAELQLKLAVVPSVIARAEPPAKAEVPAPRKADAAPRVPPPVPAATAPTTSPPKAPAPASAGAIEEEWLPAGAWPWLAGAIGLLLLLALWLWRRRARSKHAEAIPPRSDEATAWIEPPAADDEEGPIEVAMPVGLEPAAAPAPSSAPADPAETLRRRYIEERFPEISNRTIVLDDPASVVKGARLFYEDGALPRAVELLRFAIEDRPDAIRPWLALFEIYRLERLSGEYAELAARFRERHGSSDKWEKVRAFGREIDPGNPAYQDSPSKALETIGPREARRLAQAHADPIAENWLDAPMDFENEVLATELRRSLMARGAVEDRDLAPNPMPALRSVEMFSVG